MGPTISKSEGQRLGLNQDAYNRFRSGQRSGSIRPDALVASVKDVFSTEMEKLKQNLERGPGLSPFELASEVKDNWSAHLMNAALVKFAELDENPKRTLLLGSTSGVIAGAPDASAIERFV